MFEVSESGHKPVDINQVVEVRPSPCVYKLSVS